VGAVLEHKYRAFAVGQRANDGGAACCNRAPFDVRRTLVGRSQERNGALFGDAISSHPNEVCRLPSSMCNAASGDTIGLRRLLLFKMVKAGEVLKAGRGRYVHPSKSSPDKYDKKIRIDCNGELEYHAG
jgi:hypothetical protein